MRASAAGPGQSFERRVARATVIVLGICAAAYVLWLLVNVLLLLFACSLVSLILLTITKRLRRYTRLPFGVALGITSCAHRPAGRGLHLLRRHHSGRICRAGAAAARSVGQFAGAAADLDHRRFPAGAGARAGP
jgi:hypothetical protein